VLILLIRKLKNKIKIIYIIIILLISYFNIETIQSSEPLTNDYTKNDGTLTLNFSTNSSIISNSNGSLGILELYNDGDFLMQNINIDFSYNGNFSYITNKYDKHQEITSLTSGSNITSFIEVALNTTEEDLNTGSADVCLIFDTSGSMIGEIDAFKNGFENRINDLLKGNPSLRIGIIVYGWDKHSEFPTLDVNNYLELNESTELAIDFIETLDSSGGYEPWGDALYLANSWNWRDNVDKMIIMAGDEDCDPGFIIGSESEDVFYNGSELVDIVQQIRNKGIKINTILANGYDEITENQFNWISKLTNGLTVDLTKLSSDFSHLQLPIIIDNYIRNLINEFNVELTAEVSWEENTLEGLELYNQQLIVKIGVDNSSPMINFENRLDLDGIGLYNNKIFFTITDRSEINNKSLFITTDDLTYVSNPIWILKNFTTLRDGKSLYFEMKNLTLNQHFSYFIYSSDVYGNVIQTNVQNITIEETYIEPNYSTEVFFVDDNSSQTIFLEFVNADKGYIWIDKNQDIILDLLDKQNFSLNIISESLSFNIYEIISNNIKTQLQITLYGNWSGSQNTIRWVEENNITLGKLSSYLDSNSNTFFASIALINFNSGILTLNTQNKNFSPRIYVFDDTWNYIGTFSNTSSLKVNQATYYIWIIFNQTSSDYTIQYTAVIDPIIIPNYRSAPNIAPFIGIFVIILIMLGIYFNRKK